MALGEQRSGILAHVFRHAALLVFSGIVFGIAGSFFAAGLLKKFLFDVSTLDWVTFATVPALLILAVIPAVWVPARRASAVDPMLALRCE